MAAFRGSYILNLPLNVYLTDSALSSWVNSTRRLFKNLNCPICYHPGRVRRGLLLCDACGRGWPLDDIQDLISEIDAAAMTSSAASSRSQPGSANPQDSGPGCFI